VLLDIRGAELRMWPRCDQHQGQLMTARAFAAAMWRNQLGFQGFDPMFQPSTAASKRSNSVSVGNPMRGVGSRCGMPAIASTIASNRRASSSGLTRGKGRKLASMTTLPFHFRQRSEEVGEGSTA
jgi:hypothetical protein